MKKIIPILLILGLFFSLHPVKAAVFMRNSNKLEFQDQQELKHLKKKKSAKRVGKDPNSQKQAKDLKKKEIEIKEHSTDKNRKVKRVSVDENLPETIHQRNIP